MFKDGRAPAVLPQLTLCLAGLIYVRVQQDLNTRSRLISATDLCGWGQRGHRQSRALEARWARAVWKGGGACTPPLCTPNTSARQLLHAALPCSAAASAATPTRVGHLLLQLLLLPATATAQERKPAQRRSPQGCCCWPQRCVLLPAAWPAVSAVRQQWQQPQKLPHCCRCGVQQSARAGR